MSCCSSPAEEMRGLIVSLHMSSLHSLYILYMLLSNSCACSAAEVRAETDVLDRTHLMDLYSKGVFRLESVSLKKCLSASPGLTLTSCEPPSVALLWKWVSRHRLFNLGTSRCLGINTTNLPQPEVGIFDCDVSLSTMWWRCGGNMLYGAMNNKLAVVESRVVVKKAALHQWRIYGAVGEGPCAKPYEDIHTLKGNSHGMPCSLPFKYNNKWFWDCTSEGREDRHPWCATTSRYDKDEKWGFCPNPVSGCSEFWESYPELNACYQFNLFSILTWSQALTSCQSQGGSLLSITQSNEQTFIKEKLSDLGVMVWIGLNHLSHHEGWQWSDGSPLSLVSYTTDLTSTPVQQNQQCGVFNSSQGLWQSLSCESALPYICKKTLNSSRRAEPLDNWQYKETICPDGWLDHNGFCYRYVEKAASWDASSSACRSLEGELLSIHSLSQQELLLKLLSNVSDTKVWIGLYKEAKSPAVQWSDNSPVTFTSWYSQEPSHLHGDRQICVTADRKDGRWQFKECEEQHKAVCKTSGLVLQQATGELEEGCPEGWRRKDSWCYKISDTEQTFEDAVKGYYCKSPLVTIESRFEQAFLNSLIIESGGSDSQSYWTALQDQNRTGEYRWLAKNTSKPLTYTNWNRHQPVSGGGCVVMSGGRALGHWEVKNCHAHKALALCKQEVSGSLDTLTPAPSIDLKADCPPGWESRAGLRHCFKVYHSEKILMRRTWTEAEFFCRALGADLASFHHYEDQAFVKQLLSRMFQSTEGRWFWVGFTKRNPLSGGAWEWSDGTPMVTMFIEDMNEVDSRNCAIYSDLTNTLMPQSCDSKYEWICKVPRGVQLIKPYWYSDQHEPWVFFRGAEYFIGSNPFPWESVSFACKMMGADLLSVHSIDELDFIKGRLKKDSQYWWIGLSANSAHNGFSWTDGSALNFENWENGRPNRKPGQNCIQMSSQSGQWSTGSCTDSNGYLCKRRTVTMVELPQEPHYIGSCPENWFYYGHKCLFLYLPSRPEEGKTWHDAQSICSSYQGSLVSIDDEIEQAYIVMLLHGQSPGVWIGVQGSSAQKWDNDKPVNYNNWEQLPNEKVSEEPLCTYLSNSHNFRVTGLWQDDICTESVYGFVCQKNQDTRKRPTQPYYTSSSLDVSEYKNHSYHIIHGNLSWYAAQKSCQDRGASLVSITDPFQQAYIIVMMNRLGSQHWIGLYSTDDGISYQWSDGTESSFNYWDVSIYYPEGQMGDGGCVLMDVNGRWKDSECDQQLSGAICYIPPPKSIAFSYEVVCPDTWVKFRGSCYSFKSVMLEMTLEEARDHCRKKGNFSDVLAVQDDDESRFFLKEMWHFYQGPQNLWLGIIYDTDNDALTRFNGSPLKYTNWRSKAPDASQMRADTCVTMGVWDATWQLANCRDRFGFICKATTGAIKEVEVEPIKGIHNGVKAVGALVAILLFAVIIGSLWILYKRNSMCMRRFSSFGSAYYRQTNSQASDQDENVLLPELETQAGD